jgi:tRNA threonylcarbamoyladenosine biosynthesis protein TsaB
MLLGIETAAELVGVALADDAGPLAATSLRGERRHAEVLAPAIAHLLDQAGVPVKELDAVAVDVGPGLFTGLRVGVATAQGLAEGLGIGVVGVTSVAVLAREVYEAGWSGEVVAVVDARRGEVFAARYAGPTAETHPPARCTPGALADELRGTPDALLVGTGAHRHAATFAGLRVAGVVHPSPRALVQVAAGRLRAGEGPLAPAMLRPVYLREADARIHWVQR